MQRFLKTSWGLSNLPKQARSQPQFRKARQVPYSLRPKVDEELKRLQGEGILSKVEWSDWATPIVPVPKQDGSVRICGDFKGTINPTLQAEQYPLPRIEDIFAHLAGGKKFSKIDLRQAYHQIELEEESKKYLTINTSMGLFQYNRLVFGIISAPAIWQRTMDNNNNNRFYYPSLDKKNTMDLHLKIFAYSTLLKNLHQLIS